MDGQVEQHVEDCVDGEREREGNMDEGQRKYTVDLSFQLLTFFPSLESLYWLIQGRRAELAGEKNWTNYRPANLHLASRPRKSSLHRIASLT